MILKDHLTDSNLCLFFIFCVWSHSLIVWLILSPLHPSGHSGGGSHDCRAVFWRQHAILGQRQRSPADFNPRYQRQHSDPPKAAVLSAADPPGPGWLRVPPRLRLEHRPGSAGSVKQPTLWTNIRHISLCFPPLLRVTYC